MGGEVFGANRYGRRRDSYLIETHNAAQKEKLESQIFNGNRDGGRRTAWTTGVPEPRLGVSYDDIRVGNSWKDIAHASVIKRGRVGTGRAAATVNDSVHSNSII